MLDKRDRILVIVPHPDDETLGCGGILQRANSINLPVRVVYLTYGDANEWSFIKSSRWKLPTLRPSSIKKMGKKRYREAINACRHLGVDESNIFFLGYPDFSTLRIWYKHWRDQPPAKGMFTRSTEVPYDTAYRPGAKFMGEEILKDLESHLLEFNPTKVFTSHRLDFNADHQALYLFVRIALWNLKGKINPKYFPFLTHYKIWPQPRGKNPKLNLNPPELMEDEMNWTKFPLHHRELKIKVQALNEHKTQMAATPEYLNSFIRQNELFGDFKILLTKKHLQEEIHQEGELTFVRSILEDIEEDDEFIGFDDHSIRIDEENLTETIKLTRKFRRNAVITFYIFAYKHNKDFGMSPKFRIKIKNRSVEVIELNKKLDASVIELQRNKKDREIILLFPLYLLKNPDYLLINVRSEISNITVDWVPWRIVKMN